MLLYTPTRAGDIALAQERRAVELEAAAVARMRGDLDAAQTHQDRADTWADIIEVHRGSW
jgi:hypothetical protein